MSLSASAPPPLASRFRRSKRLISLTPLVDVVFILLIFFMLASSFVEWRAIELNAPGPTAPGALAPGTMLVTVAPEGLRLGGRSVTLDELAVRVAERLRETPEGKVLVRVREGVALQEAVTVLDRLSALGAPGLTLLSAPGGR